MTASRWHTGPLEVFDWLQETDTRWKNCSCHLSLPACKKRTNRKRRPVNTVTTEENEAIKYPDVLPILPLRGVVVYPQTAVPFDHRTGALDQAGG